jgi:Leucine-rich repeat (LRR) protein
MATAAELITVNLDHAKANRDAFLKTIFDETIIGYGRFNYTPSRETYEELLAITAIYYEAKGAIGVLRGLQYLKNLTLIRLNVNEFTDIGDLSGLTKLATLECYLNKLTYIGNLVLLTKLVTLKANNNKLISIGRLDYSTLLQTIELQINKLTSIGNISNCTALVTLNLSDNLFESFPATYIPWNSLVTLNLEANRLTTANIDAILAAAVTAKSTYNKIATIKLSGSLMGIPTGGNSNASVVALRAAGVTVEIRTA